MTRSSPTPMISSLRLFGVFRPAPSPAKQVKESQLGSVAAKGSSRKAASPVKRNTAITPRKTASLKHTAAPVGRKQGPESAPVKPERSLEAKSPKKLALEKIPNPPKGVINGWLIFRKQPKLAGLAEHARGEIWRALSESERHKFNSAAAAENQLRAAQFNEWARNVGYQNILTLNHARHLAGRLRVRIPDSMRRPPQKAGAFMVFYKEKYASGEIKIDGPKCSGPSARHAAELWRQLSLDEKAVYEARSKADYEKKLADRI
ncbi:hypothetical protein BKA62DRAFT_773747 [Auriculariales sp. MPI-PUGE-AT-0066]|nr:hypothetical protein BKA62DRAFT_773747 [Auriculariales sp. MPI-PUGE-AT-0066]